MKSVSDKSDDKKNISNNPYTGLRQQIFDLEPEQLMIELENEKQVYAAVIDMPIKIGIATLVCILDGTVNLYFSNGDVMLGSGQGYEEVRSSGMMLLFNVGHILHELKVADNYELPNNEDAVAFLLTKDTVYKTQFNMNKIKEYEQPIQFLNYLIQNTLHAVRAQKIN